MEQQIVYLCHGDHKFHIQTRFSVLSLLHHLIGLEKERIRVVVYTDAPIELPVHPLIQQVVLSGQQLKNWAGPLNYVHRIKLEVLKYHTAHSNLPNIYVDCDTQWLQSPDREFSLLTGNAPGYSGRPICFMHENEGPLSTLYHSTYLRLLEQQKMFLSEFGLGVPSSVLMWNAGVIGVPNDSRFFRDAIAISDEFLMSCSVKNWVEQLAVSLIAQQRYAVQRFDHCVRHYWRSSFSLPIVLNSFFRNLNEAYSIESLAQECANFPLQSALDKYELTFKENWQRWISRQKRSITKRKMAVQSQLHRSKYKPRAN